MSNSPQYSAKTEAVCMAVMADGRICGAPAVKIREGRTLCSACAARMHAPSPDQPIVLQLLGRTAAFADRLVNHLQSRGVPGATRDQVILAILEGVAQSDSDLTGVDSLVDIVVVLRERLQRH